MNYLIEAGANALAMHTGKDAPTEHQIELVQIIVRGMHQAVMVRKNDATSRDDGVGNVHERGPTALGGPSEVLRQQARLAGYTGDACPSCGNFTMRQAGKCLSCDRCGSSSGCS